MERASYDGNGNIVAWTKSNGSAPTSRREYDAFGNTLVSEGTSPSTFGFSTKMQDVETGLYYYGYRFYDPVTGRWPSRDPIEEQGGFNLYAFVENDTVDQWDLLGMIDPVPNWILVPQVPGILQNMGHGTAASAMLKWFSRSPSDDSPVDGLLTMSWALMHQRIQDDYDILIDQNAFNSNAEQEIRSQYVNRGVGGMETFDYAIGKASVQDSHHYQHMNISDPFAHMDDFAFAVGRASFYVVPKGCVDADNIFINSIGVYIKDSYSFSSGGNDGSTTSLGYWNFKNKTFEGYFYFGSGWEMNGGVRNITNGDFSAYSRNMNTGGDYESFTDIKVKQLDQPWIIKK